ncbi:carbohydrate ABC transporter permease [Flexivirga meconopsidis]|uniref:carbohydrate ABC transporter permease n=1 Tax=Flexivirga meconopsidis TaxID=2977121 RepID=UPI002240ADC6|nr:sugar ABC transporter permease [Flexivirga meconopsidis]
MPASTADSTVIERPGQVVHTAQPAPVRRSKSRPQLGAERFRKWWTPLLWVGPSVAALIAFSIVPFANTVGLSFTDARALGGPVRSVGLDNYRILLESNEFRNAVFNSILYMLIAVPLLVMLPLLVACLVNGTFRFGGFFRSAFYIPAVASTVVIAIVWQMALRDDGPVNAILTAVTPIQEAVPFLSDRWLLLFSAIALTVWKGIGFYMVLYLAALANVDETLYEAATIDGAGPVRRFFHVTLPGVRPMMYVVGVLSAIGSLRVFSEIYILGGPTGGIGGQDATVPFYIRNVGLAVDGKLGLGSAASVMLFVLTVGFLLASQRLGSKAEE